MKKQAVMWLSEVKWSAEIISTVGKETGKYPINAEWVYKWIWKCKHSNKSADKGYKKIFNLLKHRKCRGKRGLERITGVLFKIVYRLNEGLKL
jgi:IS30 family transposase